MDYTLTNGKITAILRDFGAELISLKDEAGTEYLWQGDPVYWSGQAPVLVSYCRLPAGREKRRLSGNRAA